MFLHPFPHVKIQNNPFISAVLTMQIFLSRNSPANDTFFTYNSTYYRLGVKNSFNFTQPKFVFERV